MTYGDSLKYQRELFGLSQLELSKKIGIAHQNINRWERNEVLPNIDFCVKLADFYGITLDELVGRDHGRETPATKYNIGTLNNSGKIDMK